MNRNYRSIACLLVVLLGGHLASVTEAVGISEQPCRPNVVILLADDLGYGDLGCYGHPTIRTPNLDRMAREGMKFTQFYSAAPLCTPSRAALLTGRLPVRSGLISVLFPFSRTGLPASEITLPEALRSRGYSSACIGKWHLGHQAEFLPTRHGFDHFLGVPYSNDMTFGIDGQRLPLPLMRDEKVEEAEVDPATLTERYTAEAVRFLREHGPQGTKRGTPFLLYLAYSSPHTPIAPGAAHRGKSRRGPYGDSVEELDASAGRILQVLRDELPGEDTIVIFTSDNGPWLIQGPDGGSAGPLREGKGSTWEGGVREPCLVWWPRVVGAGQVTADIACTMDWFVTVLELAGADLGNDRSIDGVSLAALLRGSGSSPRRVMPYFNGTTLAAVRKGPWKIHLATSEANSLNPLRMRLTAQTQPLLFHLEHDPAEKFDVAYRYPEVVADLVREAELVRRRVTPELPSPDVANGANPVRR